MAALLELAGLPGVPAGGGPRADGGPASDPDLLDAYWLAVARAVEKVSPAVLSISVRHPAPEHPGRPPPSRHPHGG